MSQVLEDSNKPDEADDDLAGLLALEAELNAQRAAKKQLAKKARAPQASRAPRVSRDFHTRIRASLDGDRAKNPLLRKCEDLVFDLYGMAFAVSIEDKRVGYVATVWNEKGQATMICAPRGVKVDAIALLHETLKSETRSMKAPR